jgi:hypothetical protein
MNFLLKHIYFGILKIFFKNLNLFILIQELHPHRSYINTTINKGCQFHFNKCFIFSIGIECFDFRAFRHAVSGLFCSYIYIYIHNSTNIIQIQDKLIINYAIQT